MRVDIECVFLLILGLLLRDSSEEGYCSFPDFLWAAMPDGSDRKWLGKTEYVRNTVTWERQKEITVRMTEMIIKHKIHTTCNEQYSQSDKPCFRKDQLYHVICLSEEPGDKFRVMHKSDDSEKPLFSCMKFVKINDNIVQVYSAAPKILNEDRLCYEETLQREEWPWIITEQLTWSKCPFEGGYDFVQYSSKREQVCPDVWRPSRMEMECIYGEGVDFFFPDPHCNTFTDDSSKKLEFKLYCWGSWDEDDFKFVLLSQEKHHPQYVLRLPQAVDMYSDFSAYLYFSPVSSLSAQGRPPGNVHYTELRMKRSEGGFCFDESEKCREFAQEGKCTNSALHEYANFCRRSCGMCDVKNTRPECRFPLDYRGEWMQFERERKESVTIASGEITFSNLGHFICKTKHWAINRYKLMSVFKNGCRPRYTCIHFSEDSEVVLQYQISSSKHIDESFKMCIFKDDPLPLGNKIRSKDMKILLPTSHIHWGSCGLSGEIRVNASFIDGSSCAGVLTDWNPRSCASRSKLILALENCKGKHKKDHVCMAHMNVDEDYSLLITQEEGQNKEFRCWAIQTYPESMYYRPWRVAMLMKGAQCGTEMDLLPGATQKADLVVRAYSDMVQQPCRESNDRILDYYDTEKNVKDKVQATTPHKHPVHVDTEVAIGLHTPEKGSIKPRERKSNGAYRSSSDLLSSALTLILSIVKLQR